MDGKLEKKAMCIALKPQIHQPQNREVVTTALIHALSGMWNLKQAIWI